MVQAARQFLEDGAGLLQKVVPTPFVLMADGILSFRQKSLPTLEEQNDQVFRQLHGLNQFGGI
jgi:hypothetical protein